MTSNTRRERNAIEARIDEMLAESFPASDPPVWGSAAARIRHLADLDDAAGPSPVGPE